MLPSWKNRKAFALALAIVGAPTLASAGTISFSDNFSPPSPLWSNSTGNWTGSGGQYYAQSPNNNPLAISLLPFTFSNVNDQVTVTVNNLGDGGIVFQGPANTGQILVFGGYGYGVGARGGDAGTSAYWAGNPPYAGFGNSVSGVFTPGNTYTLTVTDVNGLFTLYNDPTGQFDGSSVALTSISDPGLSSFQVGLYDNQPGPGGSGAVQTFSDFSVTGLAAPGPSVGEGLLSFAAMSALLIAVRYRGLIL
jgi:hypothetical protein